MFIFNLERKTDHKREHNCCKLAIKSKILCGKFCAIKDFYYILVVLTFKCLHATFFFSFLVTTKFMVFICSYMTIFFQPLIFQEAGIT